VDRADDVANGRADDRLIWPGAHRRRARAKTAFSNSATDAVNSCPVSLRRKIGLAHLGSHKMNQSHSESSDNNFSNVFSSRYLPKAARTRRFSRLRKVIVGPASFQINYT